MENNPKPDYDAIARRFQSYRYILFPTMIVKLTKTLYGEVIQVGFVNFEEFDNLGMALVDDVDDKNER